MLGLSRLFKKKTTNKKLQFWWGLYWWGARGHGPLDSQNPALIYAYYSVCNGSTVIATDDDDDDDDDLRKSVQINVDYATTRRPGFVDDKSMITITLSRRQWRHQKYIFNGKYSTGAQAG